MSATPVNELGTLDFKQKRDKKWKAFVYCDYMDTIERLRGDSHCSGDYRLSNADPPKVAGEQGDGGRWRSVSPAF